MIKRKVVSDEILLELWFEKLRCTLELELKEMGVRLERLESGLERVEAALERLSSQKEAKG